MANRSNPRTAAHSLVTGAPVARIKRSAPRAGKPSLQENHFCLHHAGGPDASITTPGRFELDLENRWGARCCHGLRAATARPGGRTTYVAAVTVPSSISDDLCLYGQGVVCP